MGDSQGFHRTQRRVFSTPAPQHGVDAKIHDRKPGALFPEPSLVERRGFPAKGRLPGRAKAIRRPAACGNGDGHLLVEGRRGQGKHRKIHLSARGTLAAAIRNPDTMALNRACNRGRRKPALVDAKLPEVSASLGIIGLAGEEGLAILLADVMGNVGMGVALGVMDCAKDTECPA